LKQWAFEKGFVCPGSGENYYNKITVDLRYGRICHIFQAIANWPIWLLSQCK